MKEKILEVLDDKQIALDLIEINDLMELKTAEELKELSDELETLFKESIVYITKKGRYILLKNCTNLKIGKLSLNKKGYGFVVLEKEDDIYVSENNLNHATDEDIVLVEIVGQGIKKEGRIIRIVKRELTDLVAEVIVDKNGQLDIVLDNSKRDFKVKLIENSTTNLVEGHKVVLELIKEIGRNEYLCKVRKIIGHKNDPQIDILTIAFKYGIDPEFSSEVMAEVDLVPNEVQPEDLTNRTDLSKEVIFTIDGDDTKDIDDAISIEKHDGFYRLGVHIADVSNYAKENTALGDEAYDRATSSYLADTVIPMFPHKLSNGICSLNEGVIRLTMSCVMDINLTGEVINYDIFESYIKSRKKMTYKKVNDIIERNIVDPEYEEYKDKLILMKELATILRKEKTKRGYIDFELDEAKIVQNEAGEAIDIIRRVRESGEMLIEDFMIAANETVASHIANMELPFLYRVHAEPNPEKIEDFGNLIKILGYRLTDRITDLRPKTMQNILDKLKDKPEFYILSSMLLRSMKKAEYSSENIGHFGLASTAYTHFTSPIRRYPDLVVHRLLKKYLIKNDLSMETVRYLENNLPVIATHTSEREVAAVNAEREVDDMKMAEYMQNHIGEEYEGIIDSVTNFGMFIQLDNLIEGLVHIKSLKGDYYNYVPDLLSLIGKNTKKTYRIGDKVKVKCVGASKEAMTIDFELIDGDEYETNSK